MCIAPHERQLLMLTSAKKREGADPWRIKTPNRYWNRGESLRPSSGRADHPAVCSRHLRASAWLTFTLRFPPLSENADLDSGRPALHCPAARSTSSVVDILRRQLPGFLPPSSVTLRFPWPPRWWLRRFSLTSPWGRGVSGAGHRSAAREPDFALLVFVVFAIVVVPVIAEGSIGLIRSPSGRTISGQSGCGPYSLMRSGC